MTRLTRTIVVAAALGPLVACVAQPEDPAPREQLGPGEHFLTVGVPGAPYTPSRATVPTTTTAASWWIPG